MKNFIKTKGLYLLGIILLFLIWEIVAIIYQNDIVAPTVGETLKSLFELIKTKQTYIVLLNTLLRLIISLLLGIISATILAFCAKKANSFKQIITPFMSVIKSTPVASIIIILLIIFGHENSSIAISFLVITPIMYEGFYNSTNLIDENLKDEIKMQSNFNYMIFKDVYFPITFPNIATTLLQSFSLGIKSLVMAELLTQPKYSIGREILNYKNNLDMASIVAWTLILILISLLIELALNSYKDKAEVK